MKEKIYKLIEIKDMLEKLILQVSESYPNINNKIPCTDKNIEKLKCIVCYEKQLDLEMLSFRTKKIEIVEARQLVAYFLFNNFQKKSFSWIGEQIGKDHATAMHCIKRVETLNEVDGCYRESFHRILEQVESI